MTFKFPPTVLAQHLAILGRTGSGKSYTAKGAVESLLADKRRVCIIDPTGIWYGLRSSADGKRAGFPVVVFGGQHADVPINELAGAALAKVIASQNLPAIIDLSEMLIGQRHRFVTDFAEALYRENRTPLHLVIDEADEVCPQNPLPETKRMLHHIDRIVRRGRVRGFRVMMITQRPAVLNKSVLTQANALIAMRLTGPQDRLAMKAWIDGQGDPVTGKVVLDSLSRLEVGEGWLWAPEIDMLDRVRFPPITTFDSGRTPDDNEPIAAPTKLAAVDITGITASFAAIEREARTVDELKAELTKLRAEMKKAPIAAAAAGVSEAEVRRRIDEAVSQVRADTVSRESYLRLRNAISDVYTHTREMLKGLDIAMSNDGMAYAHKINAVEKSAIPPGVKSAPNPADAVIGGPGSAGAIAAEATRRRATQAMLARSVPRGVQTHKPPAEGLSGPEQRILDAIAWLEALGIDEAEQPAIAFLAGYSYGGGAYNNPRGRLNQRGLVEYRPGGLIRLTDEGRRLANKPAAIATDAELHERVLARLNGPEQRLLKPLLAAFPHAMTNADLAAAAGYTPGAGAFNNPRGKLRTLGLVEYPQAGHVAARALLFPEGRA